MATTEATEATVGRGRVVVVVGPDAQRLEERGRAVLAWVATGGDLHHLLYLDHLRRTGRIEEGVASPDPAAPPARSPEDGREC